MGSKPLTIGEVYGLGLLRQECTSRRCQTQTRPHMPIDSLHDAGAFGALTGVDADRITDWHEYYSWHAL